MVEKNTSVVARLLQQIIESASAPEASLDGALLRAQVLGARLGNSELRDWAKAEIGGYTTGIEVPPYRNLPVRLRGDCIAHSPFGTMQGPQDIPIGVIPEDIREDFQTWRVTDGVAAIESLVRDGNGKSPRIPLDRDAQDSIRKQLGGPNITSVYLEVAPSSLETMLSSVRSRVLDLVLALDEEFGSSPPDRAADLEASERQFVDRVVHLHISGSGNAVSIQSPGSYQQVEIRPGDWTALQTELARLGVPDVEIDKLKNDKHGALAWLKQLGKKATNGALKTVGTSALSQITKAVLSFWGVPS